MSRSAEIPAPAATHVVPAGALAPYVAPPPVQYIGPRDSVRQQVLDAFNAGELRRFDPETLLPDGQNVLILGYPVPTAHERTEPNRAEHPSSRGVRAPDAAERGRTAGPWWSDWHVYLLALGAVVGGACLAVVLLLITVSLHAVMLWGIDNAEAIGLGLLMVFFAFLIGAGAVAKMRHGAPGRRY